MLVAAESEILSTCPLMRLLRCHGEMATDLRIVTSGRTLDIVMS